MPSSSDPALEAYLSRGESVEGWLHPYSGRLLADISRIQVAAGITGAVTEIGVHHGRLFTLLKLLAKPGEKSLAIDLFETGQHLNSDASGMGSEAALRANLKHWTGNDTIEVLRGSSLDLKAADITAKAGLSRIFSVDGGHTAECTANDLWLAEAATDARGVVILDDHFNPEWPDVATGTAQYMLNPASKLRPFAISPNKVFLARPEMHATYLPALRESQGFYHHKSSHMYGTEVGVFAVDDSKYTKWALARRKFRQHPIGNAAATIRNKMLGRG